MLFLLIVIVLVNFGVSAKNWEPDCVGDEYDGVCVEPKQCFATNPYIAGLVYPKNCTRSNGQPGVCCTDCELVFNANDAILDKTKTTGVLWKTGKKAWDKCIEYVQKLHYRSCFIYSRILRKKSNDSCHTYNPGVPAVYYVVGGENVVRGEFPHQALLGYNGSRSPSDWLCSGSLISDRFVLTAAHCLHSKELGPVTDVAFGVLKRSDPPENWQRYKIKRLIAHPEYRPSSKYHDIALLETDGSVDFLNMTVLPACLPAYEQFIEYEPKHGFNIQATGWGGLGYRRDLADTMQKVTLTKFPDKECDEQYPVHRSLQSGLDHSSQMCFGDKTAVKDTCQGDSGGPLQTDTHYPTCMHTIIGVTSFGRECGFKGAGGVYTKVAKYMPWIESVVWP